MSGCFTLNRGLFAAVAFSAVGLVGTGAHANLLLNGGFEIGTAPPNGQFSTPLSGDSTTISNWIVGGPAGASVDYISGYWQPNSGSRSIDLSGSTDGAGGFKWGSLSQTFATTLGQQYKVSFWLSGNPDGPPPTKAIDVSVGSTLFQTTFALAAHPTTRADMGWVLTTFLFVANAASQTITFSANAVANNTFYGPAIDDVDISAVPLPPALLLFGSGLLGMNWLRRRRTGQNLASAIMAERS